MWSISGNADSASAHFLAHPFGFRCWNALAPASEGTFFVWGHRPSALLCFFVSCEFTLPVQLTWLHFVGGNNSWAAKNFRSQFGCKGTCKYLTHLSSYCFFFHSLKRWSLSLAFANWREIAEWCSGQQFVAKQRAVWSIILQFDCFCRSWALS